MSSDRTVTIPEDVARASERFLRLTDSALPGRIEGLYLVGSIALDDYRSGQSDIDFVAVTRDPLDDTEMDRIKRVHQALLTEAARPWFDGIYVTWPDLERNPEDIEDVPFTHEGRLERSGAFEANPVTWLTLRNYPIVVRGPIPTVRIDRDVVRRRNLNNLNSYWAYTASRLESEAILLPADAFMLPDEGILQVLAWCVPGVLRVWMDAKTGDLTSKSEACRYGLRVLPERWHPLIEEALAIRCGAPPTDAIPASRISEVVALMRHVIDEANRCCAV